MKQVIAFVKEHVLVVVFCGTIIAALAGGWFASAGFNETVRLKAEEQARRFGELEGAEKGSITIAFPGSAEPFNAKGVINEAVVKQYGQVINVIAEDATKIQQAALARNLNGRDPYDPKSEIAEFLPRINDKQAAKVRYAAQKFVAAQYAKLLADVHAGTAPSVTEITKRLEGARLNFINQDLRKNDAASLSQAIALVCSNHPRWVCRSFAIRLIFRSQRKRLQRRSTSRSLRRSPHTSKHCLTGSGGFG